MTRDRQTRLYVSGASPRALPDKGGEAQGRWWQTPYGQWRLSAERDAMERFPDFRLFGADDGFLSWLGRLRSSLDPSSRYVLRVAYPPGFPYEAPAVFIESPALVDGTPHVLSPQRPCLYHPSQGPRNGYDPGRTTAATLVAWTALWIHAYETWRATGRWPGKGD